MTTRSSREGLAHAAKLFAIGVGFIGWTAFTILKLSYYKPTLLFMGITCVLLSIAVLFLGSPKYEDGKPRPAYWTALIGSGLASAILVFRLDGMLDP